MLIANNLIDESPESVHTENNFRDPTYTNMHTHGLHDAPGAYNQSDLETYTGGDNIFVTLASRHSSSAPAPTLDFTSNPLPVDHMPGMHW